MNIRDDRGRARVMGALGSAALSALMGCTGFADEASPAATTTESGRGASSPEIAGTSPGTTATASGVSGASSNLRWAPPPITAVPKTALWAKESIHPIRWTVPTDLGTFDPSARLEQSVDAGATWTYLTEVGHDEHYYRWTLPGDASHARIAVVFHSTDGKGVIHDLRRLETGDVALLPSKKKSFTWTKVADAAPFGPRDGAGGITYAGKMWLLGGWNPGRFPLQTANDVWSSVDGATWVEEKPNTFLDASTFPKTDWKGRHFAGYQSFAGKMWIIGGDANQGYYQTDVWSSTDGHAWTRTDVHVAQARIEPVTGQPYPEEVYPLVDSSPYGLRTAHVTGIFGGKIVVAGGQRVSQFVNPNWPGAPAAGLNDVWTSLDGATFAQVRTSGPLWSPRGFVSELAELGGKMWMISGALHDDPGEMRPSREFFGDVWATRDGVSWESVGTEPPFSARMWHDVKAYDDRLWVINGYDGGGIVGQGRQSDNLRDVWTSADGVNWYDVSPPDTFVPRHAGTAWVHAGALFVGSGNEMDTEWHADVWKVVPTP